MTRFRTRLLTAAGVTAVLFAGALLAAMQSAELTADARRRGRFGPARRLRPRGRARPTDVGR